MTPDKDSEIARLRRELQETHANYAETIKERNELATALGREVATTQILKAALTQIRNMAAEGIVAHTGVLRQFIDAVLASGNGDGGNDGTR